MHKKLFIPLHVSGSLFPDAASLSVLWRYNTGVADSSWKTPGFNDIRWRYSGLPAGSGFENTKTALDWNTDTIRFRKQFLLNNLPLKPVIKIVSAGKVKIWINGKLFKYIPGNNTNIAVCYIPLEPEKKDLFLVPGNNFIAVEAVNNSKTKYLDLDLLEMNE